MNQPSNSYDLVARRYSRHRRSTNYTQVLFIFSFVRSCPIIPLINLFAITTWMGSPGVTSKMSSNADWLSPLRVH